MKNKPKTYHLECSLGEMEKAPGAEVPGSPHQPLPRLSRGDGRFSVGTNLILSNSHSH